MTILIFILLLSFTFDIFIPFRTGAYLFQLIEINSTCTNIFYQHSLFHGGTVEHFVDCGGVWEYVFE